MDFRKFFNDFGKAFYRLDAIYDDFARNSNVSSTLLWVLYALNDDEVHTQREISSSWDLPKSTVNTLVSELKDKGYVELTPIKGKRREMTVTLTESGKKYADDLLKELYEIERKVFARLSENERELTENLEHLVTLLKEEGM